MALIKPVIMAGGTGSRLWPLSRQINPKQFLALTGSYSTMLQQTVSRLKGLNVGAPVVICDEEHQFLAAEQLRHEGESGARIILDPLGRNMATVIAMAALQIVNKGEDGVLLVLAADHLIGNESAFRNSVTRAVPLAEAGKLVTFGIVSGKAETGYGYIQKGKALDSDGFDQEKQLAGR